MIKSLHIRNYLLIEEIELDFHAGLTVITGETGAGKSLIIDSLELALGARADPNVVRTGSEKAEIYVTFDTEDQGVQEWLRKNDLLEGGEAILQRIIYRDRPSRTYINGRPATLNHTKDLASRVIAVHGQSEHQSLQKSVTQRFILDGYAGILSSTQRLAELASEIRQIETERTDRDRQQHILKEQLTLLEHQYSELSQLDPQQCEFSNLKQELQKISHASELASTLGQVSHQLFYGDESTVSNHLADYIKSLENLTEVDDSLKQYSDMLYEAQVRIDDVARELYSISERTEHDPARIAEIEERMAALQRQARIHGVDADNLTETGQSLGNQITELQNSLGELTSTDQRLNELKAEYHQIASEVTQNRQEAANRMAEAVTNNMQNLGMAGGRFGIEFIDQPSDAFAGFGHENVRFVVSTAPGQELGPLSSVASGGELSRLCLSIQVVAADLTQVPSIVFDEIDVGIGGSVAEKVGQLLRTLGRSVQIFCITHLPQVAAKGDQQLNVRKVPDTTSSVHIQQLDSQQRVMEIARMLSGSKITDRTTAHAKELLAESAQ